ncbi:MAG TPA: hypothetical protein VFR67_05605 [Pilimelia sp.]|nr:hypothetical protein [Pilimelia sp.]
MTERRSRLTLERTARDCAPAHRAPHPVASPAQSARPAAWQAEFLELQRLAGNAATAALIQRQPDPAPPPASPGLLASPALLHLDRLARAGRPTPVPVPAGLPGARAWAVPVTLDGAQRLAGLAGVALPAEQVTGPQAPKVASVTAIYTNDGAGPFPNIGGGADHELTAGAHLRFDFANAGPGWASGGYNLEIWTPQKGGPASPLPGYAPGRYPGQPGPETGGYKGLFYADFAYRVTGTSSRELTLLTKLGANSTWLGEQVQSNLVHRPLGIALFDWKHEPTEAYGALGLRARTLLDLIDSGSVSDAEFRIRLTLSSHAMGGTHDAEAGGSAMLSVRSGFVRLGGLARAGVEFRFGADGRGLARYNDQGGTRAGLEAGVSNEIRIHLREADVPWLPEFSIFAGGRAHRSTLPESGASAGEDRPSATGATLGPGSKAQGWIGVEIPLR